MPKKKLMLTAEPGDFALLGYDTEDPEFGAIHARAQVARYARHVEKAARRVEKVLVREEWNAIADVMNGCADLWDYSGTAIPHLLAIRANVEDGHRLDGLGHKWFGEGKAGDAGIQSLLRKLSKMSDLEGDAIAAAVRWFWLDARADRNAIDHSRDEWWTVAFRQKGWPADVPA